MPANEKQRFFGHDLLFGFRVVFRRITTDMLHHHLYVFAHKSIYFGIYSSYILAVYIAKNATQRLELCKCVSNSCIAKVARVPYFIALFKMPENGVV